MRQPFCILVVLGDLLDGGELRLIERVSTLADARTRIEDLAERFPGQYVIYDENTGQRISILAGLEQDGPWASSTPSIGL